jgi:hypothetical protein
MSIGKVEYRVRPITRFVVTRYHESEGGNTGGTSERGQYDNAEVAHEVAYALCKAEHEQLGWPIDDERIQYPQHPSTAGSVAVGLAGSL